MKQDQQVAVQILRILINSISYERQSYRNPYYCCMYSSRYVDIRDRPI